MSSPRQTEPEKTILLSNYAEETAPLFKLLRTKAFRFVVVRYNHRSLVNQLAEDLAARWPDWPSQWYNAEGRDFAQFMAQYEAQGTGLMWINNFKDLFIVERTPRGRETEEMAQRNAARRDFLAGLNLRRDRLARSPIALLVLLWATPDPLYLRPFMEQLPDLWSFRSLVVDLVAEEHSPNFLNINPVFGDFNIKNVNISNPGDLTRLKAIIAQTDPTEMAYLVTLYSQLARLEMDTGHYQEVLNTLDDWQKIAEEQPIILLQKGKAHLKLGQLDQAQVNFLKAANKLSSLGPDLTPSVQNLLAVIYRRLGNVAANKGELPEAEQYLQKAIGLLERLHSDYPTKDLYQHQLAAAQGKLGKVIAATGKLELALGRFEKDLHLSEDLYTNYLDNPQYQNGLAVSYQNLGNTYARLGDLRQALGHYQMYQELEADLYARFPANVQYQNGLAISYNKLGEVYTGLGDLSQALGHYQKYQELEADLHARFPANVEYQNGLAISHNKLGKVYTGLGDLSQALGHYQKSLELIIDLHDRYPANLEYQNSLAISYSYLGELNNSFQKDPEKAKTYYQQSQQLLTDLVQKAPDVADFKENLAWVEERLRELDNETTNQPKP
jgi:tetratricopeptide (TPR) repeat protein